VSRVPSLCAVAKDEEDDDKRSNTAGEAGRLTTEETQDRRVLVDGQRRNYMLNHKANSDETASA
jgi:hypothetical protein